MNGQNNNSIHDNVLYKVCVRLLIFSGLLIAIGVIAPMLGWGKEPLGSPGGATFGAVSLLSSALLTWLMLDRRVAKRRGPAMTQDTPLIDPDTVRVRTAPQPVTVEPYSAGPDATRQPGQRSARAQRVMREVEA